MRCEFCMDSPCRCDTSTRKPRHELGAVRSAAMHGPWERLMMRNKPGCYTASPFFRFQESQAAAVKKPRMLPNATGSASLSLGHGDIEPVLVPLTH